MKMESLERSKAVIELGKRLVEQLKLDDDEQAQWMAHLLAERIHFAETAPSKDRAAAQRACTELILLLWERRYCLPPKLRPFKKLESFLRTLDTLDFTNRLRRFIPEPSADIEVEGDAEKMLGLALKLDDAACILMQHFLSLAAEQSLEETKSWIQSANNAAMDITLELRIAEFVSDGLYINSDDVELSRAVLKEKIQKLEMFASLAAAHAKDLREKHGLLADERTAAEPNEG